MKTLENDTVNTQPELLTEYTRRFVASNSVVLQSSSLYIILSACFRIRSISVLWSSISYLCPLF